MDTEVLVQKFSLEFPNLDVGLVYAIASDAESEQACRKTLALLNTEAEFQPADWRAQEVLDLETALKDTTEEFSTIEIRDGKLAFKAENDTGSDCDISEDEWTSVSESDASAKPLQKKSRVRSSNKSIGQLRRMFPTISVETVNRILVQSDNDIELAAEDLLSFEALQECRREQQLAAHLEKLHLKHQPTKHQKAKHKKDLQSYLAKDIEYLKKIYKFDADEAWTHLEDNSYSITKAIQVIESKLPQQSAWVAAPSKNVPVLSYASASVSSISPSQTATIISRPKPATRAQRKELEEQIKELDSKRENNMAKANMAFRKSKSNPLYRSVAGHYSQQAQINSVEKHVALESHFDHIAADQTTSHSIDLHGLPLHSAISAAQEKLHKWWSLETQRIKIGTGSSKPRPLTLISGAGRHSSANIPKIKNGLRKKLNEEKWIYQEFESYFVVTGARWWQSNLP